MESLIGSILNLFSGGANIPINGSNILPVVMGLIIWHLLEERKKLVADLQKKDDRIDKIIDDYHNGNLTLTEALNSLKLVLWEIRGSLSK